MAGQSIGKQLIQILCVLGVLALTAFTCEQNKDEDLGVPGKHPAPQPDEVATVGSDVCTFCHQVTTEHWLSSAHGNFEAINHTTHAELDLGFESDGFPYYGYSDDGTCLACHDPLGDGRNLVQGLTGNVDRPVVGCESCHGGGAEHFGVGEMPYPKPDAEQCAQCHSAAFPDGHLTYHPEGDEIFEEYSMSGHAISLNSHNYDSTTGDVRARCARCHTDEGFRKYQAQVPGTTGRLAFRAFFTDPITGALLRPNLPAAEAGSVTCRTCHGAHTASKAQLESVDSEVIAGVTVSAQYNTCTQCHQLSGIDGKVMAGSTVGPYHASDSEEYIGDSHAAVPGDIRLNSAHTDEVFYVNKKSETACADCHNPHGTQLDVNRQWRESGHGDVYGDPWIHYDWKAASRQSCQRCHTSTGAKNYLEAKQHGTVYSAAANNFSMYLGTDGAAGNDQMESLYCWGCHSDYKGGLRDPGAYTADWKDNDGVTLHQFPDANGSNVCITCHSGRESGGTIVASTSDFNNRSFYNSHYLGAAEGMFPGGGYHYGTRSYANVGYYEHDILGLPGLGLDPAVEAVMGGNGPCVSCHMSGNPQKHHFLPVTKDGDTITAITSTLCATCHVGAYELTPDELNHEKHMYHASLDALKYYLGLRGFNFQPSHPYFFTLPTGGVGVTDWVLAAPFDNGKNNMGAAFNYNFLHHDPGGYAHNRYYSKRLIYDSIDWLDDGNLNDSVNASLTALDGATYLWKADALAYILSGTGGRP